MKRLHWKLTVAQTITVRGVDVRIERVGRKRVTVSVPVESGASIVEDPQTGKLTLVENAAPARLPPA